MERTEDTNIRTFNIAKRYSDEILFKLVDLYHKYQNQSDFGAETLQESILINDELREIQRFNGLKAMNDVLDSLLTTITSTIVLKGNKHEKEQLDKLKERVNKNKKLFYENKSDFFISSYSLGKMKEQLDRDYFEQIKHIIKVCYSNTEILMTKNKLLFSDASDEFKEDAEIMEEIKKEYAGE